MLRELAFSGFRGLEGRIGLGDGLVILVGPNCSGKTVVIEAIAYLLATSYSDLREAHWYLSLLHAARGSVQHSIALLVENVGFVEGVLVDGDRPRITLRRRTSYETVGMMLRPVVEVDIEASTRKCRMLYRLYPDRIEFGLDRGCFEKRINIAVVTPGVYPYNMFDVMVGMAKKGGGAMWRVLSEGLSVDGKLYRVDAASDEWGRLAAYVVEDGSMVSFYTVGRGLQRALTILASLEASDIILIDEVESAMHPELLAEVASRIASAALQGKLVVVATQSLEAARFLAAALLGAPRRAWRRPEELVELLEKVETRRVEALSLVVLDREGRRIRSLTLRGRDAFEEIIRGEDVRMLYTLMG